jgi:hypothetical protein
MYWWDHAADLVKRKGTRLRRFGFVTTNSITQVFQRRILERHLSGASPVSRVLAIPDHPWTKASKDAAAVRIAMTVAAAGEHEGVIRTIVREEQLDTDEPIVEFESKHGRINADLSIGANVDGAQQLRANYAVCYRGVQLMGGGFIVTLEQAIKLGLGRRPGLERRIKEYRNGRDLTAHPRGVMIIDLFGLSADEVRGDFPEVYQHLIQTVRKQRADTFAKSPTRDAQEYLARWWQFGKPRSELRPALEGLRRYIATVETMKHRVFQFMDHAVLPDNMLVAIASDSAYHLGVLSSKAHVIWAIRSGGKQGMGNDPRYSKSRCFDPFPFPDTTATARGEIGAIAEELDRTRKRVFLEHPDLTLTALYNALEFTKGGKPLSTKNRDVLNRGHVLILKELHERLDVVVMQAYQWPADLNDEQIIERLVGLNQLRAAEERRGLIKWIRPDYQIDKVAPLAHQGDRVQAILSTKTKRRKKAFPAERQDQARVVLSIISGTSTPLSAEEIAATFNSKGDTFAEVRDVLQSLVRIGQAETYDNGRSFFRAAS